jgi:hypothetical protein
MKILGRTGRPNDNPRLDARLHEIFNDRRTPGAPDTLYSYLREIAMDSSTETGRGRFRFLGSRMGPRMRTVAALALVLVVAAGAVGAAVAITRSGGAGANESPSAGPSFPATPSAPAGWHTVMSVGGSGGPGGTGAGFGTAEPRIAVHVLCQGSDDLIVMALTEPGPVFGQPLQSALAQCNGTGWQESRVEFTAATGSPFVEIYAATIPIFGSTVPTRFWVSVEVPD